MMLTGGAANPAVVREIVERIKREHDAQTVMSRDGSPEA
jgi:hypothetical protein